MPFSALQQRIGRQKQVAQVMRAVPVVFVVYDVLERDGVDIRARPADRAARRAAPAHPARRAARVSRRSAAGWDELAALRLESRERGVEGFILKRRDSRVRRRAPQGRLVEVEDRSADGRRRAHLRPAGQRPPREPAHRLHVRRLGPGARSSRWRRRTPGCRTRRSRSWTNGSGATRWNVTGRSAPSNRSRSSSLASRRSRRLRRGTRAGSRSVSPDAAMAERQARGGGRHARDSLTKADRADLRARFLRQVRRGIETDADVIVGRRLHTFRRLSRSAGP